MKKQTKNYFSAVFPAKSQNESLARQITTAFFAQLDPKVCDMADMKTAVSEAVTNVIVHAYGDDVPEVKKIVYLSGEYTENGDIYITVKDKGRGIENIEKALTPLYTTSPEDERSGMGFTVMETLTDKLKVKSKSGVGTSVTLIKRRV